MFRVPKNCPKWFGPPIIDFLQNDSLIDDDDINTSERLLNIVKAYWDRYKEVSDNHDATIRENKSSKKRKRKENTDDEDNDEPSSKKSKKKNNDLEEDVSMDRSSFEQHYKVTEEPQVNIDDNLYREIKESHRILTTCEMVTPGDVVVIRNAWKGMLKVMAERRLIADQYYKELSHDLSFIENSGELPKEYEEEEEQYNQDEEVEEYEEVEEHEEEE